MASIHILTLEARRSGGAATYSAELVRQLASRGHRVSLICHEAEPELEKIKARLIAVNSADDEVNPPELGILERSIKRVKNGRYVLIPTSDETRGHGTHSVAKLWKQYLVELLAN